MPEKVQMLQNKKSPLEDKEIEECLLRDNLNFTATLDKKEVCKGADYVIIAMPADYDTKTKLF